MSLQLPAEWTESPPRYLVAGDGPYAKVLTQVLSDAVLVTNDMLREGVDPPHSYERPLKENLEAVIVVLAEGESVASLLWRHRRLWKLPGRLIDRHGWMLDDIRWLFVAADERQKNQFAELDVLGREPSEHTFGSWNPKSYGIVSREFGLRAILSGIGRLHPIQFRHWISEINADQATAAIRDFQNYVAQAIEPSEVAREIPRLESFVSSLSWERHFPPPQHRWANQMRKWLAVTQPDTPWLEEGKRLFSVIQP